MPSRVHPAQAAQKPVICERLSLVRVATGGSGIAVSDMRGPLSYNCGAPDPMKNVGQDNTAVRKFSVSLKLGFNGRFRNLAHGISWQRIQQQQPRRNLVCCQSLFSPFAKFLKFQRITLPENESCADSFTPLLIRNSNDGALSNCGMIAQRLLNLQGGDFVPAGFQDVDVRAPENAIDAIFDDRSIASSEPAIAEGFSRGFWLTPVFQEDVCATNLDLTCCFRP